MGHGHPVSECLDFSLSSNPESGFPLMSPGRQQVMAQAAGFLPSTRETQTVRFWLQPDPSPTVVGHFGGEPMDGRCPSRCLSLRLSKNKYELLKLTFKKKNHKIKEWCHSIQWFPVLQNSVPELEIQPHLLLVKVLGETLSSWATGTRISAACGRVQVGRDQSNSTASPESYPRVPGAGPERDNPQAGHGCRGSVCL